MPQAPGGDLPYWTYSCPPSRHQEAWVPSVRKKGTGARAPAPGSRWFICTGHLGTKEGLHRVLAVLEAYLKVHGGSLEADISGVDSNGEEKLRGWTAPEDAWEGDTSVILPALGIPILNSQGPGKVLILFWFLSNPEMNSTGMEPELKRIKQRLPRGEG
jgi:hypothetical protein